MNNDCDVGKKTGYKCDACGGKEFARFSALVCHMQRAHADAGFNGDSAKRAAVVAAGLALKPSFQSKKSQSHLSVHKRIQSSNSKNKLFVCQYCDRKFRWQCHLSNHQRAHKANRTFKCELCSETFATSLYLTNHECVHTGKKRFECDSCGKAFMELPNLRRHEKMHAEKPFECDRCGKRFAQSSSLYLHQRTVCSRVATSPRNTEAPGKQNGEEVQLASHETLGNCPRQDVNHCPKRIPTENELIFTCDSPDKKFMHHSTSQRHKVTHMGEKPSENDSDGERFAHQTSVCSEKIKKLKTVVANIEQKVQLKCNICDETFNTYSKKAYELFDRHQLKHELKATVPTGIGYICFQCDKTFDLASDLEKHAFACSL